MSEFAVYFEMHCHDRAMFTNVKDEVETPNHGGLRAVYW